MYQSAVDDGARLRDMKWLTCLMLSVMCSVGRRMAGELMLGTAGAL